MGIKSIATWLTLALSVVAVPVEERQTASCSSYSESLSQSLLITGLHNGIAIINTRGTGEAQGPSAGFTTMNRNVQSQKSGGKIYNTVYPAGSNQDSSAGTADVSYSRTRALIGTLTVSRS